MKVIDDLLKIAQDVYDRELLYISGFDRANPNLHKKNISRHRTKTISKTMEVLVKDYPEIEPSLIWKNIEKAHIISYVSEFVKLPTSPLEASEIIPYLLSGDILSVFNSAGQSWKRASGVAWEEFIKSNLLLSTIDVEIRILTPAEIKALLKGMPLETKDGELGKLASPSQDKKEYNEFLLKILDDKNFDLFLIYYVPAIRQWRLSGLIQCKTSIRDRLKINMKSSEEAMAKNLWSIVIAMDSDRFTRKGQYNQGAKDSWNGFYVLDNTQDSDDSIFYGPLHQLQQDITNHCNQVIEALIMNTQSIHAEWRPKTDYKKE